MHDILFGQLLRLDVVRLIGSADRGGTRGSGPHGDKRWRPSNSARPRIRGATPRTQPWSDMHRIRFRLCKKSGVEIRDRMIITGAGEKNMQSNPDRWDLLGVWWHWSGMSVCPGYRARWCKVVVRRPPRPVLVRKARGPAHFRVS